MLKAIHAQEDKAAAREKAKAVAEKLRGLKLNKAAQKIDDSVEETLTYMSFPRASPLDESSALACLIE